jgi:two-component system response regulator AtoC
MMGEKILIVDDEQVLCRSLSIGLQDAGHEVRWTANPADAMETAVDLDPDLILLDLRLPGIDGLELLKRFRAELPPAQVIIMTAHGDARSAVQAMKLGAADYLTKPFDLEELKLLIGQVMETAHLKEELAFRRSREQRSWGAMVGDSPAIQEVERYINAVAAKESMTVLLEGESGTGKELAARAIHARSRRRTHPLVGINCAALPESLLESELFGYEKGAFSGAGGTKKGLLELAQSGTVFLDEIGEMSPLLQAKLLRFLEEKKLKRLGGVREISLDIRIVAATNKRLEKEVREGRFREDLFYRLNVFRIFLPPLRERGEDTVILARHFLTQFTGELGKAIKGFAPEVIEIFRAYHWPGNVRELRNVIERAVLLTDGPWIEPAVLTSEISGFTVRPAELSAPDTEEAQPQLPQGFSMESHLRERERQLIVQAVKQCNGNKSEAARLLGMSRYSLHRKLRELKEP